MSQTKDLQCWKCGSSLDYLLLPLSRTATCRDCDAGIHVCRMCEFYDPHVAKSCREPVAMEVKEKQRANFCDYLKLKPGAYEPKNLAQESAARSELNDLFGLPGDETSDSHNAPLSQVEQSRQQLEDLFGPDKKDD